MMLYIRFLSVILLVLIPDSLAQNSEPSVDSFYWTYACHGAAGSCARSDDPTDELSSTLEVADQTNVDLFCCATVTGYKSIHINMNQIGETRGKIYIKRKQDLDGSWTVCANQHTYLSRSSLGNSPTLTCELVTDGRTQSSLSTDIDMKGAVAEDPDIDPPYGYRPSSSDDSKDDRYPNGQRPYDGRGGNLSTGKKIAIILGSVIGGVLLLGLVLILSCVICCKKKASTQTQSKPSHEYTEVNLHDKQSNPNDVDKEQEYAYIDPLPLYQNTVIISRH